MEHLEDLETTHTADSTHLDETLGALNLASDSAAKFTRSGANIKDILRQFSQENKINLLLLDFNVIAYKSFILKDSGDLDEIPNSEINSYADTNSTIIQHYEVEIFKRTSSFYPILIQVQQNDNATELKAVIFTKRIPEQGNLDKIIYQTILNICAYRGIIIGLGWQDVDEKIADIAQRLKSSDTQPESYNIELCRLKEPRIEQMATRLLLSKNKSSAILAHDSLLLSGGFFSVKKGEMLLSYKKPRYSAPWRNIYGNLYGIAMSYPIGIDAGEGVGASMQDDYIIYNAQNDGYVSIVNGVMMISQSIIVDNINGKNIENIKEQGIKSLIVKNDALLKDAIPSGFSLNVEDLKIVGNIGAVELESNNLFINGQVHIKSNLKAKNAQILQLKGRLEAKEGAIRHCENAFVECDNLYINYLNGSKIYFTNARISHIQSNNFLFIQGDAVIKNMVGENNEFMLYPCLYGENKAFLAQLNEKRHHIKKLRNIIDKDSAMITALKSSTALLYENLQGKSVEIDQNLFNWQRVLNTHKKRQNLARNAFNAHTALMSDLSKRDDDLKAQIRKKQEEMFKIEVIFEERARVGFFVRFIDFYGKENRYHINADENNQIKRVALTQKGADSINIVCYKD